MQAFAIFGILLSVTAVMVEGTCNIYQMTTIQLDFCNYAEVITDLVPGIVSTNQLQHCIANIEKDMCRPVNDCANSEIMMADAMALLNDILNDNSCTDPCTASPCAHGSCTRLTSQTYSCQCSAGYNGVNCENEINECELNPCENGGMCVDGINSFTCNCQPGFEGQLCEININECEPNPCENGGICDDGVNSFSCACDDGFGGERCQNDIDECMSGSLCENDGFCDNTHGGYLCQCAPGFNGEHCENDIDECVSGPCENGGLCEDMLGGYLCQCAPGFMGQHCETDVDECGSFPCLNGAVCENGINTFTCTCAPGFEGVLCETDIDECASAPCLNWGLCSDEVNQYTCICISAFSGLNCENDIDECMSGSLCENNGFCQNTHGGYTCECAPGFNGYHCENDIDECVSGPCENDGLCNNMQGGYLCECAPGFIGDHCETDIDECVSAPCENGGLCEDMHGRYLCQCAPGFIGEHCETDVDECGSFPCLNGAVCENGINTFTCTCAPGFEGVFCETDIDECASAPCLNGGLCLDEVNQYTCICLAGFSGLNCDHADIIGSGVACYTKSDGSDYRGEEKTTVSGFPCQAWANTYPHRVSNLEHFLFHDHSNYCRNYAGSGKSAPWCHTGLEEFEWEYCENIPTPFDICNDKPAVEDFDTQEAEFDAIVDYDRAECYTDPQGLDYTGYIGQTVEGFQCQRWDVNYPNMRNDAKKSKPRHNSIIFGGHNYCRTDGKGPEGTTTGPWCWIADPAAGDQRWGYCDTTNHLQSSCPGKGTPVEQPRVGIYPECMLTAPGPDYIGDVDVTESGKACIAWADLEGSNGASQMYKDLFGGEGNSCRYFGGTDPWKRPWCYTSQSETEKCQVKDHYDQCFPAV